MWQNDCITRPFPAMPFAKWIFGLSAFSYTAEPEAGSASASAPPEPHLHTAL